MNILMTGSNGFIGSNLTSYFISRGHNVTEINREKNFDLSQNDWTKKIPKKNFDIVIHLAQSKNYRDFENYSNEIFRVNIQSTNELLNWAKQKKIKRFIYTSSANVYEKSKKINSEQSPLVHDSFYDLTKIISEEIISFYSKYFQTLNLRLNTVYGPGQKHALIPSIIDKVKNDEEIYLAKGKGIYLNPIFIDDLIRIIYNFSFSKLNSQGEVFNVCSDEKISLYEIVFFISNYLNKGIKTKITRDEIKYYLCDISKLNSHFGHNLKFSKFKDNLKRIINE